MGCVHFTTIPNFLTLNPIWTHSTWFSVGTVLLYFIHNNPILVFFLYTPIVLTRTHHKWCVHHATTPLFIFTYLANTSRVLLRKNFLLIENPLTFNLIYFFFCQNQPRNFLYISIYPPPPPSPKMTLFSSFQPFLLFLNSWSPPKLLSLRQRWRFEFQKDCHAHSIDFCLSSRGLFQRQLGTKHM